MQGHKGAKRRETGHTLSNYSTSDREIADRTPYYHEQASVCAAAAAATAITEIKHAYLELEQGWLSLTPKPKAGLDESLDASSEAEAGASADAATGRALANEGA